MGSCDALVAESSGGALAASHSRSFPSREMRRRFPAHQTVGEIHASSQQSVSIASDASIVEKRCEREKPTVFASFR